MKFNVLSRFSQVSKLEGCQVVSTNNQIPGPFMSGACGTFNHDGNEAAFLCFSTAAPESCYM